MFCSEFILRGIRSWIALLPESFNKDISFPVCSQAQKYLALFGGDDIDCFFL